MMTTFLGYLKQVIRQELVSMYIACRLHIMESPNYLENSLALARLLALEERLVFWFRYYFTGPLTWSTSMNCASTGLLLYPPLEASTSSLLLPRPALHSYILRQICSDCLSHGRRNDPCRCAGLPPTQRLAYFKYPRSKCCSWCDHRGFDDLLSRTKKRKVHEAVRHLHYGSPREPIQYDPSSQCRKNHWQTYRFYDPWVHLHLHIG